MNIDAIIQSLKEERSRIDAALKALGAVSQVESRGTSDGGGKRTVRRMAAAQKARWAKRKAAGK
jgi:hypothetical protein